MVWADILAEQTQLWIAIPFLHIAKERIVGLVFLDDVDDVLENTWFADALRDWNRGNITCGKPCSSAEIPPIVDGDLACIAIEGFAVCRIQSNELKRTDCSMDVICTI